MGATNVQNVLDGIAHLTHHSVECECINISVVKHQLKISRFFVYRFIYTCATGSCGALASR